MLQNLILVVCLVMAFLFQPIVMEISWKCPSFECNQCTGKEDCKTRQFKLCTEYMAKESEDYLKKQNMKGEDHGRLVCISLEIINENDKFTVFFHGCIHNVTRWKYTKEVDTQWKSYNCATCRENRCNVDWDKKQQTERYWFERPPKKRIISDCAGMLFTHSGKEVDWHTKDPEENATNGTTGANKNSTKTKDEDPKGKKGPKGKADVKGKTGAQG